MRVNENRMHDALDLLCVNTHRYVGDRGEVIGIDHFGALLGEVDFSVDNVVARARQLLAG